LRGVDLIWGGGRIKTFFHTFGCRVNQYETELLRTRLRGEVVDNIEEAELCVINTCTVTREADVDCQRLLRKIVRRNPDAQIVVTGCYATRAPEEIREIVPLALIVGNDQKQDLPALLGCQSVQTEDVTSGGITDFRNHSRAFVKIQDGCNMMCTYCIIPSVRPEMSSKPAAQVLAEVEALVNNGYQEIVLCGVRLGRYLVWEKSGATGQKRIDFVELLSRLLALPGNFRVRLSSFEITDLTDRVLRVLTDSKGKLCPSFHLPLQSGSDIVLKRMKRWYSTQFYRRRIEALRRHNPGAGLFTDVIVGFPGETREDFNQTADFIREHDFSGLHVFRYSSRSGTPAAEYLDVVPGEEIILRAREMRSLDRELRIRFAQAAVGSRRQVLVEDSKGLREGLTGHFLRVRFSDPVPRRPGLHSARITGCDGALAHAVVDQWQKTLPQSPISV